MTVYLTIGALSKLKLKRNILTAAHSHFKLPFFVLVLTPFETLNKYEIKNSLGQQVYFAAEGTEYTLAIYVLIVDLDWYYKQNM